MRIELQHRLAVDELVEVEDLEPRRVRGEVGVEDREEGIDELVSGPRTLADAGHHLRSLIAIQLREALGA